MTGRPALYMASISPTDIGERDRLYVLNHAMLTSSPRSSLTLYIHCGASAQSWYFVFFPVTYSAAHNSCSISPMAGATHQKGFTKHHHWADAPKCTYLFCCLDQSALFECFLFDIPYFMHENKLREYSSFGIILLLFLSGQSRAVKNRTNSNEYNVILYRLGCVV